MDFGGAANKVGEGVGVGIISPYTTSKLCSYKLVFMIALIIWLNMKLSF
jgi:hypothetical protein